MKISQVTLKDIARQLGISPATVSRALKNYPDISQKTKDAVQELALKLKYRPNPIARNLRKNQSNTIGVIIPEVVHNFFSTVISGIMKVADKAGYSVMLCQSNEQYIREVREAGILLASRIDGLLISFSNETTQFDHIEEFDHYGIPVVLFDKICSELNVSKVVTDDYGGAFQATEHLILQGCHRIALIRGSEVASNTRLRLAGYRDALQKYNVPFDESLMVVCQDFSIEEGEKLTEQLMSRATPDAILSLADTLAVGALKAVKRMGFSIPEDIAIIGFNDWYLSKVVEPPLSSVYQPGFEMGQIATELLIRQIETNKEGILTEPIIQTLQTTLMIRESSLKQTPSSYQEGVINTEHRNF